MTTVEELPPIEGGTPKQKLFAEGVRLKYLVFIEEELDPKYFDDAELVIQVRVHYKWWIEQAKKIDEKSIKLMIRSAKASITRAGSIELSVQSQRETIKKNNDKYLEYLQSRSLYSLDEAIEEEVSIDGERLRPW
jgi:hypothetical protein